MISILKQELVPQIDILDSIGELEENISESFLMKADETERQRLIKEGLEFRFLQSTILAKMAIYENFLSKNDNQTFNLWKNYQQSEIFYDFFNFHIFTNKIQKKPSFINYSEKSYRISEETCNQVEICQIPPKFDNFYIIAIQYYILYHQYQGRRFEKRVLSYRTIKKDDLKKSSQYELSDNNEDYIISLHENNCFKYILPCPEFCLYK